MVPVSKADFESKVEGKTILWGAVLVEAVSWAELSFFLFSFFLSSFSFSSFLILTAQQQKTKDEEAKATYTNTCVICK